MGIPKPESPEFLERCHFQVKHVKLWESAEKTWFLSSSQVRKTTHRIHVWYIYLNFVDIYPSPMDGMGLCLDGVLMPSPNMAVSKMCGVETGTLHPGRGN